MKGSFRLALSSYIVVAAGCTPSGLSTPEPLALRYRAPSGASASAVRAVRLPMAESAPGETLSIRVDGPSEVRAATAARFSASVSNGAEGSHYYYWWFVASCAKRGGCSPSSYTLLAQGLDESSANVAFGASNAERDVVVQVAEIDGKRRTGSSAEFPVMGPARRLGGGAEGFSGGTCDWFAGNFYPHTGKFTDPFTGQSWNRRFRRDYCGNRISWAPES